MNSASISFLGNFYKLGLNRTICKIAVEKFDDKFAWLNEPRLEKDPGIPIAAYGIALDEVNFFFKKKLDQGVGALKEVNDKTYGEFPFIFWNSALGELKLIIGIFQYS